ncbi:hypothetical protein RHGRI_032896 [Rhododendron griersonianum]|uniref:Uncharacterized protein n=1 Tax=Rhododendron griersonianum TaxID=479676 RepID=A0AAV6IDL1_9ERIC|nr:hypothetical protein RHGRI_032896 [Rhododendron griersonianum]
MVLPKKPDTRVNRMHKNDQGGHLLRPWFITKKFLRCGTSRATGSLMPISQSNFKSRSIDDKLKVEYRGGKKYNRAKRLREVFMDFVEHQQGLRKSLALEEKMILQPSVVEAWATAKFGGNHDASSAEDELHTKSYTSLLDMLGKYVLKNVQQVPISYNPMSYNILSSLRTVLFSSLPKGGVDNSLMYNGVACTGRQIHAMRRWTHRMASCPELPPPLEDIFKSLFWFGNYANSNGQLTMWKEETTNWFGSYAMRFERTPDLSGCYAKVSGSGQGCGAAAGQKRT